MRSSIRCYRDEGHDINCAANMRTALLERPVRGVSASVCVIDEKKNNLKVNKIDGFSKLPNSTYDDKGLRVWRAYDIGPGKLIPFDDVVVEQQLGLLFKRMATFLLWEMHATCMSAPQRLMTQKNQLKKASCLNVQNLDAERFSRASVSLKYMLKSEIMEIGPCPKAFTTTWKENGPTVFPQLIQCKQMAVQAAVAFTAQTKRQKRRLQIWAKDGLFQSLVFQLVLVQRLRHIWMPSLNLVKGRSQSSFSRHEKRPRWRE